MEMKFAHVDDLLGWLVDNHDDLVRGPLTLEIKGPESPNPEAEIPHMEMEPEMEPEMESAEEKPEAVPEETPEWSPE